MTVPDWARFRRRAAAYRLLGPKLAYLLHTRPAEWPVMAAHTALGYVLAVGVEGVVAGEHVGHAATGLVAWVIGLNGGTLAVNSAFDRDVADIAYLRSPPPPPSRLFAFGLGLMTAGLLIAALLPRAYLFVYAVCFTLSVLYSVPPARLKAVGGADWLINMWGFGTLTPLAGWLATGVPLTRPGVLVLLAFCPLFAAFYPLTQIYQIDEDRARGDRTLTIRLGVQRSLLLALACTGLAFAVFAAAALAAQWSAAGADLYRWALLLTAAGSWAAVLVPWLVGHADWPSSRHQRGMYAALGAWALTDLAVAVAWGT